VQVSVRAALLPPLGFFGSLAIVPISASLMNVLSLIDELVFRGRFQVFSRVPAGLTFSDLVG